MQLSSNYIISAISGRNNPRLTTHPNKKISILKEELYL